MSEKSYSYEQAGVSIAAGNALVKAIAPLARYFGFDAVVDRGIRHLTLQTDWGEHITFTSKVEL